MTLIFLCRLHVINIIIILADISLIILRKEQIVILTLDMNKYKEFKTFKKLNVLNIDKVLRILAGKGKVQDHK